MAIIVPIFIRQDGGETLLGVGKSKTSLRRYCDLKGTDAAKRLMVHFAG